MATCCPDLVVKVPEGPPVELRLAKVAADMEAESSSEGEEGGANATGNPHPTVTCYICRRRTGLTSAGACKSVGPGFWAPTGSTLPNACPRTGFYCPGAAADTVNTPGSSKPILISDRCASVCLAKFATL